MNTINPIKALASLPFCVTWGNSKRLLRLCLLSRYSRPRPPCWRLRPLSPSPRRTRPAVPGRSRVQFTGDSSTGNIVKYWWYFGDGYTSTEVNPLHTYNCYGTFPVYLTVTDDLGSTSTAALTINALQVLYSSSVTLTPVLKSQKNISGTLTGTVVVKDSEGYTIQGATVEATWTTPGGVVTQTAISTDVAPPSP